MTNQEDLSAQKERTALAHAIMRRVKELISIGQLREYERGRPQRAVYPQVVQGTPAPV